MEMVHVLGGLVASDDSGERHGDGGGVLVACSFVILIKVHYYE